MWLWFAFFLSLQPAAASDGPDAQHWLQDVSHIISAREKEAFEQLAESPERERFIEDFWKKRDQDPSTERNEFREEHYRRLEYADQHFTNARPGRRTDRGRI